jgi:hypothetical protein
MITEYTIKENTLTLRDDKDNISYLKYDDDYNLILLKTKDDVEYHFIYNEIGELTYCFILKYLDHKC